jgi:hypothetical protein
MEATNNKATNNNDNADTPVIPTPTQDHEADDALHIFQRKLERFDLQIKQKEMNASEAFDINWSIKRWNEELAYKKKVRANEVSDIDEGLAAKKKVRADEISDIEENHSKVERLFQGRNERRAEAQEVFDRYCLTLPASRGG